MTDNIFDMTSHLREWGHCQGEKRFLDNSRVFEALCKLFKAKRSLEVTIAKLSHYPSSWDTSLTEQNAAATPQQTRFLKKTRSLLGVWDQRGESVDNFCGPRHGVGNRLKSTQTSTCGAWRLSSSHKR